jgi:hypothetical protein
MRYHLAVSTPHPPTPTPIPQIYLQALKASPVELWYVGQGFKPVPLVYKTRMVNTFITTMI